ncbi:MAG: carbon-nitrogen hydrolase family protein [Clostridia bacterium]|nr:carbon-nitrogen hydrolase family protein [Clostridia bacterium]
MKITVIQPPYNMGEHPDEKIAQFLLDELEKAEGDLIVLPEYSNAGGISDVESELLALPRAQIMLQEASRQAKEKGAYVCVNVIERRNGDIKNSTYLFDKNGEVAFIYDKIHLPPSELKLGVKHGNGDCICTLDGIKFAFMTCYDVYFNEQIEYIANQKPDIIVIPGYQRGERTDIIEAQNKLLAFRTNAYIARASFSMGTTERGGNTMIVSPDGQILKNLRADIGQISADIDASWKYMRPAGFGQGLVRNDEFISSGIRKDIY